MRKRFLLTDLDLTLLSIDKSISDDNLKAIKKLLDNGHCFAFVTGRPFEDTLPLAVKYGLEREGVFIASYNGSLISAFQGGEWITIFKDPVSYEDTRFIFEEAEKQNVHCQTYTKEHVVALHDTDILKSYSDGKVLTPYIIEDLDTLMAYLPEPPLKVVCAALHDRPKLERFKTHIEPLIDDRLFCLFSSDRLLEFGRKDTTKAGALKFLAEYAGVEIKDTVAAGDEANDISMIEAAGTGYAVSNAREEVKAAADRVTINDHNNGAIAEIIKENFE
ncbi:MAG: HAD family hydrolase [Lachnospiraceae bacterium]|nr:HAD family hydrolase [Lachnospiraceae bacterium]